MTGTDPHPFGTAHQSRKQRRAAAQAHQRWTEQARLQQAGTASAAAPATNTSNGLRSPRGAPPVSPQRKHEPDEGSATPSAALVLAAALGATVAACVAIGAGAPVLGHGWHPSWLLGGGFLAVASATFSWKSRRALEPRTRLVAAAGGLAVVALFALGASTTLTIDGRPVAATSAEARSWRLAQELYTDLRTMADYDVLLTYSAGEARANYARYELAQRDLERLNRKWAARTDQLPSAAFGPAVEAARDGAYWGAEAIAAKARTVVQSDAALEAQVVAHREAYAGFVLAGGRRLAEAAALNQIPLRGRDAGPVE
jgi:hypothetical protein